MFLNEKQLNEYGFKKLGENVKISDRASIYNAPNISIKDNVRIDDFCILSAGAGSIEIGHNVHIACYVSIIGRGKITLENYVGLGARTSILSSTDDFSGRFLTGPTILESFTNVKHAPVTICEHTIVGIGTVILPGVTIGMGSAIGALSLVNRDVHQFSLVAGVPAKFIKYRSKELLHKQNEFEAIK